MRAKRPGTQTQTLLLVQCHNDGCEAKLVRSRADGEEFATGLDDIPTDRATLWEGEAISRTELL